MLDQFSALPISTIPGTVVSCRFPLDRSSQPGGSRPCLVLGHTIDRHTGRLHAIVAYGTSRTTDANRGHELRVDEPNT